MVTQATSLFAWMEVQPTIGLRQLQVIDALRELGPSSNSELASHLGWSINSVTPRVHELRGLTKNKKLNVPLVWPPRVVDAGVRECRVTRRTVKVWALKE